MDFGTKAALSAGDGWSPGPSCAPIWYETRRGPLDTNLDRFGIGVHQQLRGLHVRRRGIPRAVHAEPVSLARLDTGTYP